MKKVGVVVFFDHRDNYIHGDLNIPECGFYRFILLFFDESTTYEEMVRMLIQEGRLLPLDDPRLRYNLVLQAFEASWQGLDIPLLPSCLSKPVTLREGQTLASTDLTHLVMDKSEFDRYYLQRRIDALFCATSIEIRDSPPPKSPSSTTSRDWGEVITTIVNYTGDVASITSLLIIVGGWWLKKHSTSANRVSSPPSESEIVAIRLQMTDGTEHKFQEWLTDPARLKHYIDIFLQPSSFVKPVQVVFAVKNGESIVVDVSEGAQNNLQLNELLSYLNIDSAQK